jgi:hypothetical protein
MRSIPSDKELRNWTEKHLYYELQMLIRSFLTLTGPGMTMYDSEWFRNTQQETFLLHFRNLYDFVYKPVPRNEKFFSDARASDFFDVPSKWNKICPKPSKTMEEARNKANTWLSHLTYIRPETSWDFKLLYTELMLTMHAFVRNVPSKKLHPTVPNLVLNEM